MLQFVHLFERGLETEEQKGICTNSENNFCFYSFLLFVFISMWHLFLWKVNFVWNEKSDLNFLFQHNSWTLYRFVPKKREYELIFVYFVCIYYIIMVFLLCRLPYLEMFCSDWKIKIKQTQQNSVTASLTWTINSTLCKSIQCKHIVASIPRKLHTQIL